jgi:hypothetical protein
MDTIKLPGRANMIIASGETRNHRALNWPVTSDVANR